MTTVEQQIRAIQTQGVFPFGKYFGQSITDIMVSDPGYILWVRKLAGNRLVLSPVPKALVHEFDTRPLRELQAYKRIVHEEVYQSRHVSMYNKIIERVQEEMDNE